MNMLKLPHVALLGLTIAGLSWAGFATQVGAAQGSGGEAFSRGSLASKAGDTLRWSESSQWSQVEPTGPDFSPWPESSSRGLIRADGLILASGLSRA